MPNSQQKLHPENGEFESNGQKVTFSTSMLQTNDGGDSPFPGVCIVPSWQGHGSLFFYLGKTDTWAEFHMVEIAIVAEYKRIGPKPAEKWRRAHAPDGSFAPDGDATSKFKANFVKSVIKYDGQPAQLLAPGICLAPQWNDGRGAIFAYNPEDNTWNLISCHKKRVMKIWKQV